MAESLPPTDINELTEKVIGACYAVYNVLGFGFLESVCQEALAIELAKLSVACQCKLQIQVQYQGHIVGQFEADMLVDSRLILELKSVTVLAPAHEAQLVNYLVATGIDDGLLLNFGQQKMEVRRKFRVYRKQGIGQD